MWHSGHTDLARLLQNAIRWVAGAAQPVTIAGDGVVETFAWETQAGFAVHVLNYTNPAMHRGWLRQFYPIGAQKVKMSLPQGQARNSRGTPAGRKEHPVHRSPRRHRVHNPQRPRLRSGGVVFRVTRTLFLYFVFSQPLTKSLAESPNSCMLSSSCERSRAPHRAAATSFHTGQYALHYVVVLTSRKPL